MLASQMGAGEIEPVTEHIGEREPTFDLKLMPLAVYGNRDVVCFAHGEYISWRRRGARRPSEARAV